MLTFLRKHDILYSKIVFLLSRFTKNVVIIVEGNKNRKQKEVIQWI